MTRNVLLTGGLGFIGSHVVDALLKKGDSVVIVDNSFSAKQNKKEFETAKETVAYYTRHYEGRINIEDAEKVLDDPWNNPITGEGFTIYLGDIRDTELSGIIKKHKIDIINHHAAQVSVSYSQRDPRTDLSINIIGTANVLQAAKDAGVKHIILIVSGGTYVGDYLLPDKLDATYQELVAASKPFDSIHPVPQSVYGLSKETILHLARIMKVPFTALGYMNVYGPRQDSLGEAGVVAIWIERMLGLLKKYNKGDAIPQNELPMVFNKGLCTRDFMPWTLAVEANMKAMDTDASGQFFVIGTGKPTSVIELFEKCKTAVSYDLGEFINPEPRPGDILHSLTDVAKSQKTLGIKDGGITLLEGITAVSEYLKEDILKHPEWH